MEGIAPTSAPPTTADIKLVAVDLDGTLLNDSKQVSDQTVQALAGLPARGVRVVIASARPPRSVRHVYEQLNLNTLQINYNGAMIWDEMSRDAIFHQPMPGNLVQTIVDDARDMFEEVQVSCEVMDRWFADRADSPYTTETGKLFKPDVVCAVEEFCKQDITKLLLMGEPPVILRLEEFLASRFTDKVTIVRQDADLIQIMHGKVSKSIALSYVAEFYEVHQDQIMAIGDAPNDVGMLKYAGVGIAMDNAHPLVKQVANWVAPSNNDHGVHAALKRYGLCE